MQILTNNFIINIFNIKTTEKEETKIDYKTSTIRSKFFEFKFPDVIESIKNTIKFEIEDLPYAFFINKYFNEEKTNYGKYLVGCHLNPLLSLIAFKQYESSEATVFINKSDLINVSLETCKNVVEEFLKKERIFKPKIKLENLDKQNKLEELEKLALSRNKESIDLYINYLSENLYIAYKSIKVLYKINTPGAHGILGQIYLYGINVDKNILLAKHFLSLGANQGDINALNGLGDYYSKIKKDFAKAISYYIISTQKGSKEGAYKLKQLLHHLFNNVTNINNYPSKEMYLPELLEELKKNIKLRDYESSCEYVKKILNFSKEIQTVEELKEKYYFKKEYQKSFILSIFLQECGSETALSDINFLYKKIQRSFSFPFKYFVSKNSIILSKEEINNLYFRIIYQYITKESIISVSNCFSEGIGIAIDKETAFALLEIAKIKSEIPEASIKILDAYEFGIGVNLNIERALLELNYIEDNIENSKLYCFYKNYILTIKLHMHKYIFKIIPKRVLIGLIYQIIYMSINLEG